MGFASHAGKTASAALLTFLLGSAAPLPLQLLRRDTFRYLLFVDIAWAAATGAEPDSMSVSSRC